jgi:hypothetical protein
MNQDKPKPPLDSVWSAAHAAGERSRQVYINTLEFNLRAARIALRLLAGTLISLLAIIVLLTIALTARWAQC